MEESKKTELFVPPLQDRVLACILCAFLLPGVNYLYVRRYTQGWIFVGIWFLAWLMFFSGSAALCIAGIFAIVSIVFIMLLQTLVWATMTDYEFYQDCETKGQRNSPNVKETIRKWL